VVADNGSTDETREIVRSASVSMSNLRWVDASRARGPSCARNVGAAEAVGDFLLFIDSDDRATPTWLEAMSRAAARCDAVGGALDRTAFLPASKIAPGRERSELNTWSGFLPYPSGANCGLRASLLRELGGFNERYQHGGGDDSELFWRLQLHGHELCFVPDAVVEYRERPTLRGVARQFYQYGLHDPLLYKDFSPFGMPRASAVAALRAWGHLIVLAPWYWCTSSRRRQWVRSVARRSGRIVGNLRYRSRYL
jgi:glycosyltransferase involved in cell wall biosynthesis